jgi:hypothetical protein
MNKIYKTILKKIENLDFDYSKDSIYQTITINLGVNNIVKITYFVYTHKGIEIKDIYLNDTDILQCFNFLQKIILAIKIRGISDKILRKQKKAKQEYIKEIEKTLKPKFKNYYDVEIENLNK